MTVAKTSKKTRTAGEKIDDATIIAQVKMTLLYSKNVAGRVSKWPCPFCFSYFHDYRFNCGTKRGNSKVTLTGSYT
jgi:hypothetical protein